MQRAYWPIAFSSALLWTKAESGSVFTHKGKGNQQGQYSAILTKQACWARREIPSGQDRPILQSWVANQKAVFASNPAIYETRHHHKILFLFLIVPSRVPKILFNPVLKMAFLAFHLLRIFPIPNFVPVLLQNPESRVSNKGNRRSRKTLYQGTSF